MLKQLSCLAFILLDNKDNKTEGAATTRGKGG